MADRIYAGTSADFAIALGAQADIVDEAGTPVDPQQLGWAVLIPVLPAEFDVYDVSAVQYTDLLDPAGAPATTVSPSDVFGTAGQILAFTVNDAPDGDIYLVGAGGTPFVDPTFRLSPLSSEIFTRLNVLETLQTTGLADVSDTPAIDGQILIRDAGLGMYVPGDPSSVVSPVSSVNSQTGDVVLDAASVGAALAVHSHAGSAITSGTVDVARLPVGSSSSQVAAGNHTHQISGVTGLQDALDAKVTATDVAKVWPVINHDDPIPVGAVDGDIIVRRQAP